MSLSRNSIASHRNHSKTIPSVVLAKIPLHFIEIILGQFQIVSQPKLRCSSSKIFLDNSKTSPSRNSFASHRNDSNRVQICVLVKIQLHLTEKIL